MRRFSIFLSLAFVFCLFLSSSANALDPTQLPRPQQTVQASVTGMKAVPYKPSVRTFRATTASQARNLMPKIYDSGFSDHLGVSNSSYNLQTGEVWLTSINDGRGETFANAWFDTSGIQNTGNSPWPGVTVTATIQVISLSGLTSQRPALFCVSVPTSNNSENSNRCLNIQAPGQYTVTTPPFNMQPGITYKGMALIVITPDKNSGGNVYAKMLSIKLNL